jgi:hypothetical protein
MTASTPDELIAGFPHSSLPKVTAEPTLEDLKVIWQLLNTNDMSVASYEGRGHFATAHREFRLTNQTTQQPGFHSANMMIEQGRE